jgi:hypothetical protein
MIPPGGGNGNAYQQADMGYEAPSTHYSFKSNTNTNISYNDDPTGGESVKVALRVRPMNQMELARGDEYGVKCVNE